MPLTAGTRLGPYEVLAPIGAGGMGEVYRARDSKLDRDVAIKVLPSHLAADPQALARFEREAKAVAALSHPNILAIHDFGVADVAGARVSFAATELLEGSTLRERIAADGALPLKKVIQVGADIAQGLAAAHARGIIHRDLKPENVFVTSDGRVKILDFGLARQADARPDSADSPTALRHTDPGTVLGTVGYMSPEQVKGHPADARSDIFALGCVLYELAAGRRAFAGTTAAETMSAILRDDPPDLVPASGTLASIEPVIRHCLEKQPDERFQSARDLAFALQALGGSASTTTTSGHVVAVDAPVRPNRRQFGMLPMAAVVVLAAGALALMYVSMQGKEEPRLPLRAELLAPAGVEFDPVVTGAMALSSDGTRLVFLATQAGQSRLWIREFASGRATALAGTDGAIFPFWSPDGSYIGFFADGKLKKIPAAGGPVQVLADARDGRGGSWSPAGVIVFTPDILSPLFVVPDSGGPVRAVTAMADGEGQQISHRNPLFLPDGQRFLFTIRDTALSQGRLYVGSVDAMEPQLVLERGSNVALSGGHLLFMRDGNLVAQPFDPESLAFHGDLVALAQDVDFWSPRDLGNFSAAGDGLLVYRTAAIAQMQFGWAQPGSTAVQTFGEAGRFNQLRISRDGRLAAVTRTDPGGTSDVWLLDTARQGLTRLTFDAALATTYAFSPDGDRMAVAQAGSVGRRIILVSTTGAPGVETVAERPEWISILDWSADGRYIIASVQRSETGFDLFTLDLAGDRKLVSLVVAPRDQVAARLSPNGAWIAYESAESDRSEIYVSDFPAARRKIQVTSGGGTSPLWSPDGRQLYFGSAGEVMSIEVRDPARMELGTARKVTMPEGLLEGEFMPDSKRALVLRRAAAGPAPPVQLLINWTQALR
jgi:Tol biopolymer transport system component